ncbi:MAG: hypothetical protein CVT80_08585 [Alphaproteobacteria bacterium HGW-Alphaproteobacteria-2]|nr:MAG: hypothetical protein CVT80_08585 [Alphaproteobacteria bacterium HGW-Alphaproteobacteria-2]
MPAAHPPAQRPGRFAAGDEGAATVFALFWATVLLLFIGIAVDGGNAWREREVMQTAADVAAHAGAVALARGEGPQAAEAAAEAAFALNAPSARHGAVLARAGQEIRALPDAVTVRLARGQAAGNALPTYLLRLAGLVSIDMAAQSTAMLAPVRRCDPGNGVYARGAIEIRDRLEAGAGYCLHGQRGVRLEGGLRLDPGAGIGMPDLAACGAACAGAGAAAFEMNLLRPPAAEEIARLHRVFLKGEQADPAWRVFFAAHPLARDLSALDEVGVKVERLRRGDVVVLRPWQFERIRDFPAGLVYTTTCRPTREDPAGASRLVMGARGHPVRGAVLITDCPVHFAPGAVLEAALLLTTDAGAGAVTAASGARAGEGGGNCRAPGRGVVMAAGDVTVPAEFLGSNAALVAAGSITVQERAAVQVAAADAELFRGWPGAVRRDDGGPGRGSLRGLALHAGAGIRLEAPLSLEACETGDGSLLPELRVLHHAAPEARAALQGMIAAEAEARAKRVAERLRERFKEGR